MTSAEEARRWLSSAEGELEFARYYVPTRYPNGLSEGTPTEAFSDEQAADAIERAARVLAATRGHMSSEGAG